MEQRDARWWNGREWEGPKPTPEQAPVTTAEHPEDAERIKHGRPTVAESVLEWTPNERAQIRRLIWGIVALVALWLLAMVLVGCVGTQERGFQTEGGWDVTRIEQHPDPLRMSSLVLTKYRCEAEVPREAQAEGQSRFTGCVQSMPSQAYVGGGWLAEFFKTGMIASSVWAAGHEVGNMRPDQTRITQQNSQTVKSAPVRGRRH